MNDENLLLREDGYPHLPGNAPLTVEAAPTEPQDKCRYCGKVQAVSAMVNRQITDRARAAYTRRPIIRHTTLPFCNTKCSSNYQMGCEG